MKANVERNLADTIKLVDTLKEKGRGRMISSIQLATLTGLNRSRVKSLLLEEMKINSNIISSTRHGYQWVEKQNPEETKKEEEPKKVERYGDTKNDEGYMDMTAFLAMQTITDDRYKQEPGQIWEFDGNPLNNNPNWVVILKPYGHPEKGSCSILFVNRIDDPFFDARYCVRFTIKDKEYYVDPRKINQRPTRSLIRTKYRIEEDVFHVIKEAVAQHLDILQNTKIIEKVVPAEPIVEIKEVIKEVPSEPIVKVEEVIKEVPAEITEGDAIAFLEKSGWLAKHDSELSVSNEDYDRNVKEITISVLKRQYAEMEAERNACAAERDAWREAFYVSHGKELIYD